MYLFIFRIHRNLNTGTKNKEKQWERVLHCFQIAQTSPWRFWYGLSPPLRIIVNKIESIKLQEVIHKTKLSTMELFYLCISELVKQLSSLFYRGYEVPSPHSTPKKTCQFIHSDRARTKTQISWSQPSLSGSSGCFL